MADDYTKGSFLDSDMFPQDSDKDKKQDTNRDTKRGCLYIICIVVGILAALVLYLRAAPYKMPPGAKEHLIRLSIEGCNVDIPSDIVSYTQEGSKVVLQSKYPPIDTMLHIYSLKPSSVDKLEDDAAKLASSMSDDVSIKTITKYDNAVFCLAKWEDGRSGMYSYLYFGTNNNTSFYVRVDLPGIYNEERDRVRWSFNTTDDQKHYTKEPLYSFNYDKDKDEFVFGLKATDSIKQAGVIDFSEHFYMQGYQFEVPDELYHSKLSNFGYDFEFESSLTISYKYLEYKPLNKSEIKALSDTYIVKLKDYSVVDSSWISDNMLKVECVNTDGDKHMSMLFISDGNCCFMQQLSLPEKNYQLSKDNIESAIHNVKQIDRSGEDKPINEIVYFYNHKDDSMYFDDDGKLSPAFSGISSKQQNSKEEKPSNTHHFPDKDETYNWRDYTDAESFASDHEGEMDYFEALEYYKDMHEKYPDE